MEKKALLRLMVILLCLSCFVFAVAVPATRSSMMGKMDPLMQVHLAKEDLLDIKEEIDIVESRMMMDVSDYPGVRPNPHHDPKSPGKP